MHNVKISIPPPPQGSRILSEHRGDTIILSGESQGVPLELHSPETLGVMEKTLKIKEKLSSKSSGGSVSDLLAQQVFDWSIEISDSRVTFSSGALPDDCLFALRDIKRIFHSAEGYLMVELSHLDGEKYKVQVLTGKLGADDAEWLHGSLIQLFGLDQDGVAKAPVQGAPKSPPTENFKVVEQAGGSRVEIQHLTKFLHRILPLAIGAIVLPLVWYALVSGDGGGEGLLPDIIAIVKDHPVWSKVVKYIIIAGIIFAAFRVAYIVLGSLKMGVDKNSFEFKKGILGIGVSRTMSRSQMTGLEQSTWMETHRDADGTPSRSQCWRLELQGDKSMMILTDETNPEDTDWLGQFLADWYNIPFTKKSLPDKH